MSDIDCGYCGLPHQADTCPFNYGSKVQRTQSRCAYCGDTAHTTNYCKHPTAGNVMPEPTFLD